MVFLTTQGWILPSSSWRPPEPNLVMGKANVPIPWHGGSPHSQGCAINARMLCPQHLSGLTWSHPSPRPRGDAPGPRNREHWLACMIMIWHNFAQSPSTPPWQQQLHHGLCFNQNPPKSAPRAGADTAPNSFVQRPSGAASSGLSARAEGL